MSVCNDEWCNFYIVLVFDNPLFWMWTIYCCCCCWQQLVKLLLLGCSCCCLLLLLLRLLLLLAADAAADCCSCCCCWQQLLLLLAAAAAAAAKLQLQLLAAAAAPAHAAAAAAVEAAAAAAQADAIYYIGARLQTSILGVRTIGRNIVYDPPESLEKLRTHLITRTSQFAKVQCVTYIFDPAHVLDATPIELRDDLSFEEQPVRILAREVRKLRNRDIPYVKVLWSNHGEREATWELQSALQERYPHLFQMES
uniref:Chromo domain-containing protein n=1 Tax=Ananas comosus var. bracteatus TaxID=296719 RepID=A0A6V7QC19_ANACO|nr:unnamed protein product [Ananas comosus var. bracteatus]